MNLGIKIIIFRARYFGTAAYRTVDFSVYEIAECTYAHDMPRTRKNGVFVTVITEVGTMSGPIREQSHAHFFTRLITRLDQSTNFVTVLFQTRFKTVLFSTD